MQGGEDGGRGRVGWRGEDEEREGVERENKERGKKVRKSNKDSMTT